MFQTHFRISKLKNLGQHTFAFPVHWRNVSIFQASYLLSMPNICPAVRKFRTHPKDIQELHDESESSDTIKFLHY